MATPGSDENFPGLIKPSNAQGSLKPGVGKCTAAVVNNRKALSEINGNIIGAPLYACAVLKKGVLTENNEASTKNCVGPVHRPVTRNSEASTKNRVGPVHCPVTRAFAGKLDGQEQHLSVEQVRPVGQLAWNTHQPYDFIFIDADDYKNVDDNDDVPMYVQHTEAMLEEIDRLDSEIYMEDIGDEDEGEEEEEAVEDIDSRDKNNPLAVTDYIDDLYTYYKKMERLSCVPPNYMDHQSDLNENMRCILIDWLIEVHYKFELMDETLYLTVNLIDRFLALHPVVRKKLQLVGVTAMLLACKYEEVSVPVVEDLVRISDKAYSRKEVLDMEKQMLKGLQFNMSLPTPYVFMKRFLKAAQSDKMLDLLSSFLIELCLVEYKVLIFRPSLLAAAAVFTAQCTLRRTRHWSKTMEKHTSYTQAELMECVKLMVGFHLRAGSGKLRGVFNKYNTSKYGYAARVEPALFLIAAADDYLCNTSYFLDYEMKRPPVSLQGCYTGKKV